MDYQKILDAISDELQGHSNPGKVASYIPELGNVKPDHYGLQLSCNDGRHFRQGEYQKKFSTQSVAKVFSLALAMKYKGDEIWKRVDVEPSGTAFNSMVQLEYENGIPRNPFINSGALVIADILISVCKNPKGELLDFVRHLAQDPLIDYDYAVAQSESKTGFKNRAQTQLLKSFGNIKNKASSVVDFYFHLCSIAMNCQQLAQAFMVFANEGKILDTGERVLENSQTQRINALMQTCGFYDEAGEFAFRVGLPGKSGVGGGIAAVHPGKYSVAVWSPRLNEQGNSVRGMETLELLTTKTGMGIF